MVWTRTSIEAIVTAAMDQHRSKLGGRVATLRKAKGLSQEDLAREADVATQTVSRIERGAVDPESATLRSIARVLGVEYADFVGEMPDPLGLRHRSEATAQLDRIEAMLAELLERLDVSESAPPARRPPPAPPANPRARRPKRAA